MSIFSFTGVFGFVVVIALAVFWVVQFARLMGAPQTRFAGAWDKYAWVAAFVFLWQIAPFAYLVVEGPGGASWRHPFRRDA